MAYDPGLAARLSELLEDRPGIDRRKMFGGLALLCRGHMFVGIAGETLMVRVGPERYPQALRKPHVREMDFTGRPMKGYVYVDPAGYESDEDLAGWVDAGLALVASLPDK